MEKYIDIMLNTPLFNGFDSMTLTGMKDCLQMSKKTYTKGSYIIHTGQVYEYVGIVVEGEAAIIKDNALGQRIIIEILTAGDVFGEMAAFSRQKRWYFSVQAQHKCTVIFIPKDRIIGECAKLCSCHRRLIENFLTIISDRGIYLDKRIEYLAIKSIVSKICTYLYDQFQKEGKQLFDIPLNRKELAEFLNVSRPTLSRELAKLKDDNILDYYLNTFQLKDIEKIKQLSNTG